MLDAVMEEMQGEHRLTGAGGSADQGAATDRQAALTDIIKALDAGGELLHLHLSRAAGWGKLHGATPMKGP